MEVKELFYVFFLHGRQLQLNGTLTSGGLPLRETSPHLDD